MNILDPVKIRIKNLPINRKIFWSMAAASTMIILIILAATCSIIFTECMNLETASSIQDLNHISNQFDFFLTSVDNYAKTIIVNSTVQDLTDKFNKKSLQYNELDQIGLKDEINKIIQSTEFIYAVNIYGRSRQLIASTEIATNQSSIKNIDISGNRIWLSSRKVSTINRHETVPVLMMIQKFYSYSTGEQLGYIEISIPETSISNIYNTHLVEDGKSIFIVNAQGYVQSTDGSYPMYSLYSDFRRVPVKEASGYRFEKNNILFYRYFPKLDWYIISQVGSSIFLRPIYTLIVISILIAICGAVVCTVFSQKISKTITSPIYKLVEHIHEVIRGHWKPVPDISDQNEIGFLFNRFNDMLEAQGKLKDNLIQEQKMKQKLSLDLLQEQVNPHFLYNTLDNICSLAEIGESERLIEVVMNLSRFYRETLSKGSFFVRVEDEISITRAYLNIMHIRYYDKFDFSITCPEALKKYKCLKLLLQPIVENSIYHGITHVSERGRIDIAIAEAEDGIVFTVCDNGAGITRERIREIWQEQSDHFGLKNVDQRIKLCYGNSYGLRIEQNGDRGCTVTIQIAKEM